MTIATPDPVFTEADVLDRVVIVLDDARNIADLQFQFKHVIYSDGKPNTTTPLEPKSIGAPKPGDSTATTLAALADRIASTPAAVLTPYVSPVAPIEQIDALTVPVEAPLVAVVPDAPPVEPAASTTISVTG